MKPFCEGDGGELLVGRPHPPAEEGDLPERVRGEVALTAPGGFQLDESPTGRVKRAHQGDAHAQYDQPVADDDACNQTFDLPFIPEQTAAKPNEADAAHGSLT